MPRKPTPPPPELDELRELTRQLADLRARHLATIHAARAAGATGEQLAEASGYDRRHITRLLAQERP